MRVLLLNPPNKNEIVADNPSFIDEERGFNPPLGILYIAAYLRKNSNHQIKVLDSIAEELGYPQIRQEIEKFNPDVIGLTSMTFTMPDVMLTIRLIRDISKNIKIVLGGPHVCIYPNETIALKEVDFLVLGEGEIAFKELLENIGDLELLKKTKSIVFKDKNGQIVNTGPRPFMEDLDSLPFPARDMTNFNKYSSVLTKRQPATTTFTSRGCPFNCLFCYRPHMGRRFRMHSPKYVVDEIQACFDMGIKEFLVYDDTFTVNRQRVMDICDELIKRDLDIGWDIRARVDTIDEELLKKLKQAKCERIHYGVEAGTDKILKSLRKGITLSQVENAFKLTKKIGMDTLAYFMIGSPDETREDILETIKFAKKIDPAYVHVTIATPFPGTDFYFRALEQKVISEDYWLKYAQDPDSELKVKYWQQTLNKEELFGLLKLFYKRFYGRPGYIIKKLSQVRSLGELKKKAKAGSKILFSDFITKFRKHV